MNISKDNFIIKSISMKKLLEYYKPDLINGYCLNCNKSNKVWSCPNFDFNTKEYINNYNYATIICYRPNLNNFNDTDVKNILLNIKDLIPEAKDSKFNTIYFGCRLYLDELLLKLEQLNSNSTILFSGRCLLCKTCQREFNLPCLHKEKLRYSLESLGFDVSNILKDIFDISLQWNTDNSPEYVTCVSAIFSKIALSEDVLTSQINTLL